MIKISSFSKNLSNIHHIGRKSRKERRQLIVRLLFFYIFDFNPYYTSQITHFHRNTVNDWFAKMALFHIPQLEDVMMYEESKKAFVAILGLVLQFGSNRTLLCKYGLNIGPINKMIVKNKILNYDLSYKKWYSLCLKDCPGLCFLLRRTTTYLKTDGYDTILANISNSSKDSSFDVVES